MKRLLPLAFLLLATPAMAQPTSPNWQAIAVALRNQRDAANDAAAQQQVTLDGLSQKHG